MERRFVIREWGKDDPNPGWTVTESELCRRWDLTLQKRMREHTPTRELLPILIHGEGEKGGEPPDGLFHGPGMPKRITDDQPAPSPTRAEWEAWADYVAKAIMGRIGGGPSRTTKIRRAMLSMPIVPKKEAIQDIAASTLTPDNKTRCITKILQGS